MGYVKIFKDLHRNRQVPIVTVGSSGVFYLNSYAMQQYFEGVDWVDVYYDEEKEVLGIKPLRKEDEGSFKLSYCSPKDKSTGVIAARSVTRALKIPRGKKKVCHAKWNGRRRILEFEI